MGLADRAVGDRVANRLMGGVETAVEADLERDAGARDLGERAVELLEVERDRLLAQDRLAGRRRAGDQVGMGGRARADRDSVDVLGSENVVDTDRDVHAELVGDRARGVGRGVADGGERDTGHASGEQLRVHAPDPPDADDGHAQRCGCARGVRLLGARDRSGHRQSSRSEMTSSHRPLATERRSAAWTLTTSTASPKPGENGRPSATARQNS